MTGRGSETTQAPPSRAQVRALHKNKLRPVFPCGSACERKTGKGGRDGNMSRGQEKTTQRHSGQGSMFPDEVPRCLPLDAEKIRSLCITFFYLSNKIFTVPEKIFYRSFNTKKMLLQKNFFCHKKSLSLHHQVYL